MNIKDHPFSSIYKFIRNIIIQCFFFLISLMIIMMYGCTGKASENNAGGNFEEEPAWMPHPDRPVIYTTAERKNLVKIIKEWKYAYHPDVKLLQTNAQDKVTSKNLGKMHAIRWSIEYAAVLMAAGTGEYVQRALDIIDVVLGQQQTDPGKPYYGNWPTHLELPFDKVSVVDGNQAEFNAIALMHILFDHGQQLPEDMKARIEKALIHAAAHSENRKIGPTYTNAYMMSSLVLLVVGEYTGDAKLTAAGKDKLGKISDLAFDQGTYTEYNSPVYMFVTMNAVYRMLKWIRDKSTREILRKLYDFSWEQIALYYHFPTGQWAGPHQRNMGMEIMSPDRREIFETALYGLSTELEYSSPMVFQIRHHIPEHLHSHFEEFQGSREILKSFWKSTELMKKLSNFPVTSDIDPPEVIGTTWISDNLAIGSVSRSFIGIDRRNLIAHFGTKQQPAYMTLQFLKDDRPFSAVQFFSVQDKYRILAALNFSTNGGDMHWHRDRIDGKFQANDLRMRFEFVGSSGETSVVIPDTPDGLIKVSAGDQVFYIKIPVALFDKSKAFLETGRSHGKIWVDLVLYRDEKRIFHLNEIGDAVVGFALTSCAVDETSEFNKLSAKLANERLNLEWGSLSLSISSIPAKDEELQKDFYGSVDGNSRRYLK